MARENFAGKLRKFLQSRPGQELSTTDMVYGVDLDFGPKPRRRLNSTISDFVARGELVRIRKGVYRYHPRPPAPRPINERIWIVLRARRSVTVEDLQELAGAAPSYAKEVLQTLQRQGIVRHQGAHWVLIKDPVHMPANTAKAARLRVYHRRKKAALESVDQAMNALLTVRQQITGLTPEEGGDHDE